VAALVVHEAPLFPDQWIYVHDAGVRVARITNFNNWGSSEGAAGGPTRLTLEYFCGREGKLWSEPDERILARACEELKSLGLARNGTRMEGKVFRMPSAYPVYDLDYRAHREVLKKWITGTFENVHPLGRGGLHNYNSQDHAMMSAALSVRNILEGARLDVWRVNTEQEYAEEQQGEGIAFDRLMGESPAIE